MPDQDSLDEVFAAFETIDDAYPAALAAASGADKQKVEAAWETARDAKDEALGKALNETDAEVADLAAKLKAANDEMTSDLDGLKQVSKFINLATKAANLAASLAKLAG